jgi:hypothetical protein
MCWLCQKPLVKYTKSGRRLDLKSTCTVIIL